MNVIFKSNKFNLIRTNSSLTSGCFFIHMKVYK